MSAALAGLFIAIVNILLAKIILDLQDLRRVVDRIDHDLSTHLIATKEAYHG